MEEIYYDQEGKKLYVMSEGGAMRVLTVLAPAYGIATDEPATPETTPEQYRKLRKYKKKKKAAKKKAKAAQPVGRVASDDRREAILADILKGTMKPREIAEKHGVSAQTVYNIKASGKAGMTKSRGRSSLQARREQEEAEVFDEETRERIKGMRDQDMTTSEIAEFLKLNPEDVAKVMSRHSDKNAPAPEPMSQEQYDAVRSAMHDREFSTLMYARNSGIRPREINAAIKSTSYEDYLASR